MKNKFSIGILLILFSALLMTSCESYPGYDDYVEEQLISVSSYDTNTNFSSFNTFSISDTVVIVDDGTTSKVLVTDVRYPYLQKYSDKVKENMTKIGYTYAAGKNSDLGVMLSLVKKTNTYVTYPWWWWEYCTWYYWDCGYYPYYPYPYPVVVGGYSVGVVAMDMFDLKHKTLTQVPAVWTGVVRGLYTGTHTDAELGAAIDECFTQTVPFQK